MEGTPDPLLAAIAAALGPSQGAGTALARGQGLPTTPQSTSPDSAEPFELVFGGAILLEPTGNSSPPSGVLLPEAANLGLTTGKAVLLEPGSRAIAADQSGPTLLREYLRPLTPSADVERVVPPESFQRPEAPAAAPIPRPAGIPVSGLRSPLAATAADPAEPSVAPAILTQDEVVLRPSGAPAARTSPQLPTDVAATLFREQADSAKLPPRGDATAPERLPLQVAASAGDPGNQSPVVRQEVSIPSPLAATAAPPVQGGQPAASAAAPAAETLWVTPDSMAEDVADHLVRLVQRNGNSMRVQLNPPELGSIEVRVAVNDDRASVVFQAAHPAARDALEQALPRLKTLLESAGMQLGDASVASDDRSAERQSTAEEPLYLDGPSWSTPHSVPAKDAAETTPLTGGIDLYV